MSKVTPQSFCIKNGLTIYPVFQKKDFYKEGKIIYKKDNWYIEVNNNGDIKKYKKSVGVGNKVLGNEFAIPIRKTYQYYFDQIRNKK